MTIKTTYDTKIKYVIILTIFTGITVAIQGYNLGSIYYFGFVLLIPLLVSYYILKNKIKRYMITAEWGKHPNKKTAWIYSTGMSILILLMTLLTILHGRI